MVLCRFSRDDWSLLKNRATTTASKRISKTQWHDPTLPQQKQHCNSHMGKGQTHPSPKITGEKRTGFIISGCLGFCWKSHWHQSMVKWVSCVVVSVTMRLIRLGPQQKIFEQNPAWHDPTLRCPTHSPSIFVPNTRQTSNPWLKSWYAAWKPFYVVKKTTPCEFNCDGEKQTQPHPAAITHECWGWTPHKTIQPSSIPHPSLPPNPKCWWNIQSIQQYQPVHQPCWKVV